MSWFSVVYRNLLTTSVRYRIHAFLLALVFTFCSGCATYNKIAHYPSQQTASELIVSDTHPSTMSDFPIGVYYDEGRRLAIRGSQEGLGTSVFIFGVLGALASDSSIRTNAKELYDKAATTDIFQMVRELMGILQNEIVEAGVTNLTFSPNQHSVVEINPFGILVISADSKARLYATVKASLIEKAGETKWQGRYFASAPGQHHTIPHNSHGITQRVTPARNDLLL